MAVFCGPLFPGPVFLPGGYEWEYGSQVGVEQSTEYKPKEAIEVAAGLSEAAGVLTLTREPTQKNLYLIYLFSNRWNNTIFIFQKGKM